MKVLFVSSGNLNKGISPIVKTQGESLIKNGIKLDFFTIQGKGVLGYLENIPRLNAKLKTSTYDLVHAHYALSGWVSILSLPKTPTIISFMGSDLLGAVYLKRGRSYFHKLIANINRMFAGQFCNYSIVKAENLKLRLKTPNVEIIPNGVDFEIFFPINMVEARKKINLPLGKKLVLFPADPRRPTKNFHPSFPVAWK